MPAIHEMLREARDSRASTWNEYRALLDTLDGAPSAEQTEQLERMDADLSERTADIDRLERAADFERRSITPQLEPELQPGSVRDTPELRSAFGRFIRGGLNGEQAGLEYRALAVGTDSAGGYAVPDLFRNEVQATMKSFGGVREVATTITTDSGQNLEWPTFDGTAQVGAILAENTQVAELDPAFGIASLDSYLWSSKLVRVPIQLTQDGAVDMESFLRDALAERIARIQNTKFTVGTGTGEPDGVAVGATVGVTAASGTAITADEIISLVHSIDPAYRAGASFMMHDNTIAAIRKLKATTNEYLWQPGMQQGVPDSLYGYPVVVNQDMDGALAVNDIAALFGNFKRYYIIRDVRSFELLVLRERYADYHQIGYVGFSRSDGTKADLAAVKSLKMAAV